MTKCGKDILINREGTEQQKRYINALDPKSVKLNNFDLKDWMQFAYDFGEQVNYFSSSNDKSAIGNWQKFLKSEAELDEFLQKVKDALETDQSEHDITPHLTLFVCFIKLLELTQIRFNQLTTLHLDFYYQKILQIDKLPASRNKVHVLFELAKNAMTEKVSKASELDAGIDADGKKLIYNIEEELIVNNTNIAQIKSIYHNQEKEKIKAAEIANSYDGFGEDFPDDKAHWWPFGYYEFDTENAKEYPELADANIGFALSGEILELAEGLRTISITANFNSTSYLNYTASQLNAMLEIYCTGEKGWLGPFSITDTLTISSRLKRRNSKLDFTFQIPKDEEAIVKYDTKIHKGNYETKSPVCKVLLKTENTDTHALYLLLTKGKLSSLQLNIKVNDIKNLTLSNDVGPLKANKPFLPFGNQPVIQSKFYIDYPELFKKKEWSTCQISIKWKNLPLDLKQQYLAYRELFRTQITPLTYLSTIYGSGSNVTNNDLIVEDNNHFSLAVEINNKENWEILTGHNEQIMFDEEQSIKTIDLDWEHIWQKDKAGPIRLSLNQSFMHEMYPRIYALAMSSTFNNALIPNEPYTPEIEEIHLNYEASAQINVGNYLSRFLSPSNDLSLIHEHPFGQALQQTSLKRIVRRVSNTLLAKPRLQQLYTNRMLPERSSVFQSTLDLIPKYEHGGELYLGLEKAIGGQTVSLLIQLLEGSEKPDQKEPDSQAKVTWYVLCENKWTSLSPNYLLLDETDNFLRSGLVKISIPREANTTNSLLPQGFVWLKAQMPNEFNSVCKAIGIHTQAAKAQLSDNKNKQLGFVNNLEADSISKLIIRKPKIKSLSQPYNSFGGITKEASTDYYRRVSERIRHKNRAITAWDYEHLILQNFPCIHKVKCLNHTCSKIINNSRNTNYLVPGSIVLVVVPDITNKNVFDIYQPRVSKAKLNQIKTLISQLISPHISIEVINPYYEEVTVDLKVKLHRGYDNHFYTKELEKDITKLLSPWVYDKTKSLPFGVSLHKSVLIEFTEKLDYVDFVTDFKLYQSGLANIEQTNVKQASPSSPEAILVSSKSHNISAFIDNSVNNKPEHPECRS